MTNEEIQELIINIRGGLHHILARALRPDELVAFVLEAVPRMEDRCNQLVRHMPTIFGSESDRDAVYDGLHEMKAVAELAELTTRQPYYKKKLIDTVKMQVHRVAPVLVETYMAFADWRVVDAPMTDAPMTNEEILEAEKLIASMRDELALIAGTTDADKLAPLVLEKVGRMFDSLHRVLQHIPWTIVSGADRDQFSFPPMILSALAQMAARRPDYKVKLLDAVPKQVPIIEANLDKIAHVLREKRQ